MKSIGVVRRLDEVGRIVLPISLREALRIQHGDAIEIYFEGESIVLQKYREQCVCCGSEETTLKRYQGKNICTSCVQELKTRTGTILDES